jgi:hypothetical protein
VAESSTPGQAEELYTCERCGRVRPVAAACACGGQGQGRPGPIVPPGWDPALTRGGGTRLQLVPGRRPPETAQTAENAETAETAEAPGAARGSDAAGEERARR